MEKITKEEVEHIARLSRFALTNVEKEKYVQELSRILDWVEQLNKVNTDRVEPIANILNLENIMEEDIIKPCDIKRENLLQNAPIQKQGFIQVKEVLK